MPIRALLPPPLGEDRGGSRAAALLLALACTLSQAAPFTPTSDAEVVETLPLATDPAARRVESMRRQLAARPQDSALRIDIARRYFDLAMAQGDPRLVGYASAALAPMAATAQDNADYWLALGLIQQYSHQFGPALESLARAARLQPTSPEPLAWRAAIFMVQARYPEALAECQALVPLAEPLLGAGCLAYVQATTGQLQAAYDNLLAALKTEPKAAPGLVLWVHTRLAEMAQRLQRPDVAQGHFKTALVQGLTDQFLLGAYADFLLVRKQPAAVLQLLGGWERSDILLLRLALAGRAAGDARAADWAMQLRDRFAAAAQRGDRLHEQEAARFELELEGRPAQALKLAQSNYEVQKEPRDAEILMRTAVAANQAAAAQPALDWLRSSRYQEPVLQALAGQLAAAGAKR